MHTITVFLGIHILPMRRCK